MSRLPETINIPGRGDVPLGINAVDQLVNFFSPARGKERFDARLRVALGGGYTGADRTRRANQAGWRRETDADGAILPDLQTLREDSQHMARNNPLAVGVLRTNVTKVVGTGLKVKPQIDRALLKLSDEAADAFEAAARREFALASETVEIDIERQNDFSGLQALAFLKVLEDGDILANLPRLPRPGSPYKLKIQLIESARISTPIDQQTNPRIFAGVEKDEAGAIVKFHVASHYPGGRRQLQARTPLDWKAVPAFSSTGAPLSLFLIDKSRPNQSRGVPYLAPVVELIKQLGRYTDAEVMAAVVSGMLTVFVTSETGEVSFKNDAPTQTADTTGLELGYGSVVGLLPGEKIDTVNPGRPNPAFDPFVMAILRQIGAALEIPFELLVKHFTASYSASRAALMEAWDYFRRRRHWLATRFCQPVYEAILTEAIVAGRLKAPGFFADPLIRKAWLSAVWIGDAPYHLDPLKEINAAEKRLGLYLTTRDEECAAMPQGGDHWESKLPQLAKEQRLLAPLAPVAVPAVPAASPVEPDDDDTKTGDDDATP